MHQMLSPSLKHQQNKWKFDKLKIYSKNMKIDLIELLSSKLLPSIAYLMAKTEWTNGLCLFHQVKSPPPTLSALLFGFLDSYAFWNLTYSFILPYKISSYKKYLFCLLIFSGLLWIGIILLTQDLVYNRRL